VKCAVPSCLGHGVSKNTFGVGDRCAVSDGFDPTGHRMDTEWDRDRDLDGARQELFELRESNT